MRHDHERLGAVLEALLRARAELELYVDDDHPAGPTVRVRIDADETGYAYARMADVGVLGLVHVLEQLADQLGAGSPRPSIYEGERDLRYRTGRDRRDLEELAAHLRATLPAHELRAPSPTPWPFPPQAAVDARLLLWLLERALEVLTHEPGPQPPEENRP